MRVGNGLDVDVEGKGARRGYSCEHGGLGVIRAVAVNVEGKVRAGGLDRLAVDVKGEGRSANQALDLEGEVWTRGIVVEMESERPDRTTDDSYPQPLMIFNLLE